VKGTAKVAYWDTEQQERQRIPPLLGEIRGTPTIRLYVPHPKRQPSKDSHSNKVVTDYNGERKASDMSKFLADRMPNFVEPVKGPDGLRSFREKARKHGLPQALLFTSKAKTLPLTKYLSTEFRRRMLLGEVHPTKPNRPVMDEFGIDAKELPALLVVIAAAPNGGDDDNDNDDRSPKVVRYEGDGFTKNKLQSFLSKYALKNKVFSSSSEKPQQRSTQADDANDGRKTHRRAKPGGDGEL